MEHTGESLPSVKQNDYILDPDEMSISDSDDSQLPPMIRTEILVLAKTHGTYPNLSAYRPDLVIHCGDLTRDSSRQDYDEAFNILKSIDAPLKIVIPGFNDKLIHSSQVAEAAGPVRQQAREVMRMFEETETTDSPIVMHTADTVRSIKLANGAYLRYFAGPYTPPANHRPRFIMDEDCDVALTYGPPYGILDQDSKGHHLGSPELLGSLVRFKPRVHCFGQVFHSRGSNIGMWKDSCAKSPGDLEVVDNLSWHETDWPGLLYAPPKLEVDDWMNKDTLFVNASMRDPERLLARPCVLISIKLPIERPPGWFPSPTLEGFH
jgi:hypothetical protein